MKILILLCLFWTVVGVAAPAPGDPLIGRIDKLETELQVIRDYNDDLVSMVVWSLGSLVGVALVLVGFNWFQSTRTLKRDFDALSAENKALLQTAIQEKTSHLEERLTRSLKEITEAGIKAASTEVTNALTPVRKQLASIKHNVADLEYAAIESEVERWMKAGIPENACQTAAELLQKGLELEIEYRVSEAIDHLTKALAELESKGRRLDADWLSFVQTAIEALGSEHKTARSVLLAKLAKIHS